MSTVKGDKSRVQNHQAVRDTLDRVFPNKEPQVKPVPEKPAPQANPFPHIKIP